MYPNKFFFFPSLHQIVCNLCLVLYSLSTSVVVFLHFSIQLSKLTLTLAQHGTSAAVGPIGCSTLPVVIGIVVLRYCAMPGNGDTKVSLYDDTCFDVLIPCHRSMVDNCTLHDCNEKRMLHI